MNRVRVMLRTLTALSRDPRIPRPVRWLLVVGLLPIPGPFDEAIALLAVALIAVFWRSVYREVRAAAAATSSPSRSGG